MTAEVELRSGGVEAPGIRPARHADVPHLLPVDMRSQRQWTCACVIEPCVPLY